MSKFGNRLHNRWRYGALEQGESIKAIAFLEQALAIRKDTKSAPEELAKTQFAMAKALWQNRADVVRAHRMASDASANYSAAKDEKVVKRVKQWVATHRLR